MARIIGAGSPGHEEQMRKLAEFVGAESIEYKNLGKGEDYVLTKGGQTLVLKARGNMYDGGFLAVDTNS